MLAALRSFLDPLRSDALAGPFLAGFCWDMEPRVLPPAPLPCLEHLARAALAAGAQSRPLANLLAEIGPSLHWGRTYTAQDFGARFMDNYGWTEIFGTRGHFSNGRVAGGFLLLGPGVTYPDHHHEAEEIYVPLTGGSRWKMAGGEFRQRRAGEVIHHASNVSHAMRTDDEPLLALYLWRGGPLAQRSIIDAPAAQARD